MPHKGTRSTVSVAGVGLTLPRSGGDSREDAWRERGDAALRIGSKPAGANGAGGSWRQTRVARRVSADAGRAHFQGFPTKLLVWLNLVFTVEIICSSRRSSDRSAVRRLCTRPFKKNMICIGTLDLSELFARKSAWYFYRVDDVNKWKFMKKTSA